jgi:hypothetical protein
MDDVKREARELLKNYSHITSLHGVSHLAAEAAIGDALTQRNEARSQALKDAARLVGSKGLGWMGLAEQIRNLGRPDHN